MVAERKVRGLLRCGADVTVVSPKVSVRLKGWIQRGEIRYRKRPFRSQDLRGADLIIAATDDPNTQEAIARSARRERRLVNIADRPELSSFIAPALVTRGDLTLAISTGGQSPALAQKLKKDLERRFSHPYGEFLALLGAVRKPVMDKIHSPVRRRRLFHRLLDSGAFDLIKKGKRKEAKQRLATLIRAESAAMGKAP